MEPLLEVDQMSKRFPATQAPDGRPTGLLIFPGDADALQPGIRRAVEAGIPVACVIGDVADSGRSVYLGISSYEAGQVGGEMLAQRLRPAAISWLAAGGASC
jgi:ABC-type sugar transport system substrate-binding protein